MMLLRRFSLGISTFVLALVAGVSAVQAQGKNLACYALPGGECPPTTIDSLLNIVRGVANFLLDAVSGVAMFFIIWGGLLMVTSLGDESKFSTGRNSIIYACIGLAVALSADMFLFILTPIGAAGGCLTIWSATCFQDTALTVLAIPVSLLNIIFSIVIVITAFRLVLARGKANEIESARNMLIYAIIGAIIVNLAKAIYTAVANIFV